MEISMWVVGGALAIASIPVLVIGTWYVVMTLVLGLADGGLWLLEGSRITRGREKRPVFLPMPA